MELYLIRHGASENFAASDESRALTPEGREDVERVASHVTESFEAPSLLLSSPYQRAVQTAECFANRWDLPIQTAEWLQPPVEPSKVLAELRKLAEQNIALVGHLPNLGLLLGTLVWGLPPKEVVLPKGGIALLRLPAWEPGSAKLQWLLSAEVLR